MEISDQRYPNVSKQATLLDDVDVCPHKLGICGRGLNRPVLHVLVQELNVDHVDQPPFTESMSCVVAN